MWHLGTCFSGGLGRVRLMVGLNDLKALFQPKLCDDSMAEEIFLHNSQNSLSAAKVMFHMNLVSYLQENFEKEIMQMLSSYARSHCYGNTKADPALERNIMQSIEYADLKHFSFDVRDSVPLTSGEFGSVKLPLFHSPRSRITCSGKK